MTVTVNFTSIPPRFKHLQKVIDNLRTHTVIDDIVVHVPREYTVNSFQTEPLELVGARVNMVDEDYGPITRYIYAQGDDVIIIIDDDTWYDPMISATLVDRHRKTGGIWGGSGFNFVKYFKGDYSKTQGEQVQVVEGYGMIVMSKHQLDTVRPDIIRASEICKTADDLIMSNLYEKHGFKRFVYFEPRWIRQLDYGFGDDALHKQNGGSHTDVYRQVLKRMRESGEMYFNPVITYGITVCNEAHELEILLEVLVDTIVHSDEICVLVDETKVTPEVHGVLGRFKQYINQVRTVPFNGNFAKFKNELGPMARGSHIFQIDADEVPTGTLIANIYEVLGNHDLVFFPRVNIILGVNEQTLKSHSFTMNNSGFINFPDQQGRLYKKSLQWGGKVHEMIQGAMMVGQIAHNPIYALWHVKTVRKSRQQSEFYSKMCA